MELKGNSGYGIDCVVRKSCNGKDTQRLKLSCEKQEGFISAEILTPKITKKVERLGKFYFEMEFINGCYLPESKDYKRQFQRVVNHIKDCIDTLDNFQVCASTLRDKVNDVLLKVSKNNNAFYPHAEKIKDSIFEKIQDKSWYSFPIGEYHGDLTLTNIISNGDRVYFIDFLDCYIESPLMDIIKLRQDTEFHWVNLFKEQDNNRLLELDGMLKLEFSEYLEDYYLLQAINLFRVLPFCSVNERSFHILKGIKECTSYF